MSDVIQKIIAAATGIPPRLSENRSFWASFNEHVVNWAQDFMKCDQAAELINRQIVSFEDMEHLIGQNIAYLFSREQGGVDGMIVIPGSLATHYAASRLDEPLEALSQVSEILARLVSEEPAKALWASFSRTFADSDVWPDKLGTPRSQDVKLCLEAEEVYVELKYMLSLNDCSMPVWIVLSMTSLDDFARKLTGTPLSQDDSPIPNAIRESIKSSGVMLDAVLEKFQMTLGEASRLSEGQVLKLSNAETSRLSLCVNTIEGSLEIAEGEMGVLKDGRALKLSSSISDSFVRNMADL